MINEIFGGILFLMIVVVPVYLAVNKHKNNGGIHYLSALHLTTHIKKGIFNIECELFRNNDIYIRIVLSINSHAVNEYTGVIRYVDGLHRYHY